MGRENARYANDESDMSDVINAQPRRLNVLKIANLLQFYVEQI